jgi:hypothetical protein
MLLLQIPQNLPKTVGLAEIEVLQIFARAAFDISWQVILYYCHLILEIASKVLRENVLH